MNKLFNLSKYVSFGVGVIFAAFVIFKVFTAYRTYRYKKSVKEQAAKQKKQDEIEESLKFELLKNILTYENNTEVEQKMYFEDEESEFEYTTNHSSSK